jgi:uridylate kinase
VVMCRENRLPIRVFNLHAAGELMRLVRGGNVGTLVTV